MLFCGVALEVYRLVHDNTTLDWRGPPIAEVTALCMGLLAGLALRAANRFNVQLVRHMPTHPCAWLQPQTSAPCGSGSVSMDCVFVLGSAWCYRSCPCARSSPGWAP